MHGSTISKILIAIVVFVIGWTTGQVCESISPFVLDKSIGLSDVLSVIVDILLACLVASLIEKGMQNQRVEKDFYINELNDMQDILTGLERNCSQSTTLSLNQTTYELGKVRKTLVKLWKTMKERNGMFHKKKNALYTDVLGNIKLLNSQLTDTKYFGSPSYNPLKISRGHIYLNKTISSDIDNTFGLIKDGVFNLKIAINEM